MSKSSHSSHCNVKQLKALLSSVSLQFTPCMAPGLDHDLGRRVLKGRGLRYLLQQGELAVGRKATKLLELLLTAALRPCHASLGPILRYSKSSSY